MQTESRVSCRRCRERHKSCTGERPCPRCQRGGVKCEEALPRKRGRPTLASAVSLPKEDQGAVRAFVLSGERDKELVIDYAYEVHDARLMCAHRFILSQPERIYNDPFNAAGAFGLPLTPHFFVGELGPYPFLSHHTLMDHYTHTQIKYMSEPMLSVLEKSREEITNMLSLPLGPESLRHVCTDLIQELLTTPLPNYGVRRWTHRKVITTRSLSSFALCTGYILSDLRTMFVCLSGLTKIEKEHPPLDPSIFIWDDMDIFQLFDSSTSDFLDVMDL